MSHQYSVHSRAHFCVPLWSTDAKTSIQCITSRIFQLTLGEIFVKKRLYNSFLPAGKRHSSGALYSHSACFSVTLEGEPRCERNTHMSAMTHHTTTFDS